MRNTCRGCGASESQAIANAKALGLELELQSGVYTCCQVANWAREQLSAWREAAKEDCETAHELRERAESKEAEAALVPVRVRRPRVG